MTSRLTHRHFYILWSAGLVMTAVSFAYVMMGLGPDATQGYAQKIFFFHVPSALAMYAALSVAAIFGGIHLFTGKNSNLIHFDEISEAAMATALMFATIVIVSGPIWAKPIWGVYWTWDPRLTTTFLVFILILGYHFARRIIGAQNPRYARKVAAILAILALADAPLIHYSVRLWRGIHPSVLRNPDGLPENFRTGLELMLTAHLLIAALTAYIFWRVIHLRNRTDSLWN